MKDLEDEKEAFFLGIKSAKKLNCSYLICNKITFCVVRGFF
jgi:hypothetical protein